MALNFDYAAKLTAVNAISLASIAWAPPAPSTVALGGAVAPQATLSWEEVPGALGYKIYWRDTTSPTWDYAREVGNVTSFELKGMVVDNYFFGVAAIGANGQESIVRFPNKIQR